MLEISLKITAGKRNHTALLGEPWKREMSQQNSERIGGHQPISSPAENTDQIEGQSCWLEGMYGSKERDSVEQRWCLWKEMYILTTQRAFPSPPTFVFMS